MLTIFLGFYLTCSVGVHVLKAAVPRLAGCVVVGLALPLATGEAWKFSLQLGLLPLSFIAIALLVPSYLYLFIETNNALANVKKSRVRAGHILLRLCNLALFFSWMATTVIGSLVPSLVSTQLNKNPFFTFIPRVSKISLGACDIYVFLPTWLLFAMLSVFIGIYLQILWHERLITSRL